jgi:glyoxalase family protein
MPMQLAIDEPASELGRKLCSTPAIEEQRIEIERKIALRPAPTPFLPA